MVEDSRVAVYLSKACSNFTARAENRPVASDNHVPTSSVLSSGSTKNTHAAAPTNLFSSPDDDNMMGPIRGVVSRHSLSVCFFRLIDFCFQTNRSSSFDFS